MRLRASDGMLEMHSIPSLVTEIGFATLIKMIMDYIYFLVEDVLILQVQLIVGVVIQLIYGEIMIRQIIHTTVLDGTDNTN